APRADHVFNDDALAKGGLHPVRHDACNHIHRPARGKRHNHGDRTGREGLGSRASNTRQHSKQHDDRGRAHLDLTRPHCALAVSSRLAARPNMKRCTHGVGSTYLGAAAAHAGIRRWQIGGWPMAKKAARKSRRAAGATKKRAAARTRTADAAPSDARTWTYSRFALWSRRWDDPDEAKPSAVLLHHRYRQSVECVEDAQEALSGRRGMVANGR